MAYQIKHLKLGGILDQAISIIKNHFGLLFTIMLLLAIPCQLLSGFIDLSMAPEPLPDATEEEILFPNQSASNPFSILLNLFYAIFVTPVTTAAVIHSVARLYLGQSVTAVGAIKYGIGRFVPLFGTSILANLAIAGGAIVFVIVGLIFLAFLPIVSVIFFVVAAAIAALLSLWFALSQHVVVIERIAGSKALGRSRKLVRPHLGTLLVLGLILLVIAATLMLTSLFLIPQPHIAIVAYVLASAIVTILWTATSTVFYFSCRCAEENFDLHYLAESLGEEEASGEQTDPLSQPTY